MSEQNDSEKNNKIDWARAANGVWQIGLWLAFNLLFAGILRMCFTDIVGHPLGSLRSWFLIVFTIRLLRS